MSFSPAGELTALPNPLAGLRGHFQTEERGEKRKGGKRKGSRGSEGKWYKITHPGNSFLVTVGRCISPLTVAVADELVGERDKFRLVTVELDSTFTELTGF